MEDLFNKLNKTNKVKKRVEKVKMLKSEMGKVAEVLTVLENLKKTCADEEGNVTINSNVFDTIYQFQVVILGKLHAEQAVRKHTELIISKMSDFISLQKEKVAILEKKLTDAYGF